VLQLGVDRFRYTLVGGAPCAQPSASRALQVWEHAGVGARSQEGTPVGSRWTNARIHAKLSRRSCLVPDKLSLTLLSSSPAHQTKRSADRRLRASTTSGCCEPSESKNCSTSLRPPSSFHLRSRFMISSA